MFKVTRTQLAPPSLAALQRYDAEDVLMQLRNIFYDKCYLCEEKEPYSINVEHFIAHQGSVALKFDWKNLFYVCARCNNIKLARYNALVNCTDPALVVWKKVRLLPPRSPGAKVEVSATDGEPETTQTSQLLDEIYNSAEKSINKRITSEYLRKAIYRKVRTLLGKAEIYLNEDVPEAARNEALASMKEMMKGTQEFSAFLRWTVTEDSWLSGLLAQDIVD